MVVATWIERHRALARVARVGRSGCKRGLGKSIDAGGCTIVSTLMICAVRPRSWSRRICGIERRIIEAGFDWSWLCW
jgi:hypothetical protein